MAQFLIYFSDGFDIIDKANYYGDKKSAIKYAKDRGNKLSGCREISIYYNGSMKSAGMFEKKGSKWYRW